MDDTLIAVARAMLAPGKGLLAIDESTGTCNARFASLSIAQTESSRRSYRELLVSTAGLSEYISAVILYDETAHQHLRGDQGFLTFLAQAGMVPGIKVDLGAKPLAGHAGERVTEGLDGLRERLVAYHVLGARFAKWRAVFSISASWPTRACIEANAHALARYAALCQEAGLLPIVEPEVLVAGAHTLERCEDIMQAVLLSVFEQLDRQGVRLEEMILKPAMVLPGSEATAPASPADVAAATLTGLRRAVPAAVAGVAFLSGGQPGPLACTRLSAMHSLARMEGLCLPWPLTFSFGRALQQPAMQIWAGAEANAQAAQHALLLRARCSAAAARGEYVAGMEAT